MKEKLKNKKVIGIGIAVIIAVIAFIGIMLMNKSSLVLKNKEFTVEYGQQVSKEIKDYLNLDKTDPDKKNDILAKAKLDINIENEADKKYPAVGEYKAIITYNKDSAELTIIVKDTIAPTFEDFKETIETAKDVKPDYTKLYQADDLSQVEIICEDTNVKYETVGNYKATVKAIDTSKNEILKEITVKVTEPAIKLDKSSINLYVKETVILKPEIKGKEQKAIFKSSNDKIASVDGNGKVTAKKKGTVTITSEANGVKAECKVTVKETPKGSTTEKKTVTNPTTGKKEEVIIVKPSKPNIEDSLAYNVSSAKEAFNLQNQKRIEAGVSKLIWNNTLYEACKIRAKEASQKKSHTRPDGRSFATVLTDVGYPVKIGNSGNYLGVSENLAWGYSNASSAIKGWYSSKGHKGNMLDAEFTKGAIARYGDYWIAIFSDK